MNLQKLNDAVWPLPIEFLETDYHNIFQVTFKGEPYKTVIIESWESVRGVAHRIVKEYMTWLKK